MNKKMKYVCEDKRYKRNYWSNIWFTEYDVYETIYEHLQ